jgi:TonB family protein
MKMNTWTIFFWVSLAHLALGAAIGAKNSGTKNLSPLSVKPLRVTVVQLAKPLDNGLLKDDIDFCSESCLSAASLASEKIQCHLSAEPKSKPRLSKSHKKLVIREALAQTSEPVQAPIPMALSDLIIEHQPEPVYPTMSKRMGEEGKVIVRFLVGMQGAVERTEIVASSGVPPLDQAALDAVRHWKFSPPKKSGTVHAAWVMVPILFTLG